MNGKTRLDEPQTGCKIYRCISTDPGLRGDLEPIVQIESEV